MSMIDDGTIILLVTPIVLLQFVLMIINLMNWTKRMKTKFLSRALWLLIIILGGLIGNIIYMVVENDSNKD